MWTHDCRVENCRIEIGSGESCNWCGSEGNTFGKVSREAVTRLQAETVLYRSIAARLPQGVSLDAFKQSLEAWQLVPLKIDGQLIGAAMLRGNEIHVGFDGTPIASIRRLIRETLGAIIGKHGSAITSVRCDHANGLRFCQRLGFEITGFHDGVYMMRCERLNHV